VRLGSDDEIRLKQRNQAGAQDFVQRRIQHGHRVTGLDGSQVGDQRLGIVESEEKTESLAGKPQLAGEIRNAAGQLRTSEPFTSIGIENRPRLRVMSGGFQKSDFRHRTRLHDGEVWRWRPGNSSVR
jgi:hypothetical protein